MVLKNLVKTCIALCISAVLATALCGCDDLGEYEDAEQYYGSFESVYLLSDDDVDGEKFSVAEYFYNDDSRENFLTDEEGNYDGVDHNDYVYMAIPFENDIVVDTLALYLHSNDDVTVYINVYVTDKIPTAWKPLSDNKIPDEPALPGDSDEPVVTEESGEVAGSEEVGAGSSGSSEEKEYDDPDPASKIGAVTVSLKKEVWNSFLLDYFLVSGATETSIQINEGQYILFQFRNNSGVRDFDTEEKVFIDPDTGLDLPRAEITMTNLLIRALEIEDGNEAQGGE